jgi:hypothetical protein
MPNRRRLIWILAIVLAAPPALYSLGVAYFIFAVPTVEDYRHRLPFDSVGWKARSADAGSSRPTRLRMVDDLLGQRRLDGLAREQVVDLLGSTDETDKWREWDLVYYLGPERSFMSVDSEWLVIRLDAGRKVATYHVVRD